MKAEDLVLDLEKIKKEGEFRYDENFRFRVFLKSKDTKRLDDIVHSINDEVSALIDCTKCGNCCKELKPTVTHKDIKKISVRINRSQHAVKEEITETVEGETCFKNLPCIFLSENKCTIYEDRPQDCSEFPFLNKKSFNMRLWGVIGNYSICPIVYNVFEILKKKYNFRR